MEEAALSSSHSPHVEACTRAAGGAECAYLLWIGGPSKQRDAMAGMEEHSLSLILLVHVPADNFSCASASLTSTEN